MTARIRQLLLDPLRHAPGVAAALLTLSLLAPAAAQEPTPSAPAEPAAQPAPESAATTPVTNPVGEFYGPVKPAETLWSIANRMRPDNKVATEQVLVALYRANPRAFEGTINKLTKGAVLRVPTRNEMTALSVDQARVELRRLWKGGAATAPGRPVIDPLQIAPPPPAGQPVSVAQVEADATDVPAEPPAPQPSEAANEAPSAVAPAPKPQLNQPSSAPPVTAKPAGGGLPGWQTLLAPVLMVLFVAVLAISLSRRRRRAEAETQPSFQVPPPAPEAEPEQEQEREPEVAPTSPAVVEAAPVPAAPPTPSEPAPVPVTVVTAPPALSPEPAVMPARHAESLTLDNPPLATDPISTDEIGTKLDLARAYIEMGEPTLARVLLREVLQQGDAQQQNDAEALLARLP